MVELKGCKRFKQLTISAILAGTFALTPLPFTNDANTNVASAAKVKSEVTTNADVSAIINTATSLIGSPYEWGGTTPNGFDCSGFINYVYEKHGIDLPRTVASIWKASTPVNSPSVGDIVFFETRTGPSHVGIYIGDNEFIHAGASTGVTISSLDNSYWKPRYLGAKRVV